MKRLALGLALACTACGGAPEEHASSNTSTGAENMDPTDAPPEPTDPTATPPDVAAIPPSATRTQSGLASRILRPGSGAVHPSADAHVRVHYTGWTTDGHMFDSSRTRGEPPTFPLSAVIPGWTEGVQLMVVGEVRRFWMPAALAYGDHPRVGAPAGMLVFDIELIAIEP